MNTHYGVVVFSGDPGSEHPDGDLRGHAPQITLIACGDETFCWGSLAGWTARNPLRLWETAEVLTRTCEEQTAMDETLAITDQPPNPPACLVSELRCLQDRYGPDTVRGVVGRLDDYGRLQPAADPPGQSRSAT